MGKAKESAAGPDQMLVGNIEAAEISWENLDE
jgi:hypothetical protein